MMPRPSPRDFATRAEYTWWPVPRRTGQHLWRAALHPAPFCAARAHPARLGSGS
jgi:hypothetical protein